MIILKHNDCVYIAYCSGSIDTGAKENLSVWRTGKNKSTLVGVFGSSRLADALRYERIVTGEFNKNSLVLNTVPAIQEIADRFDLIKDQCISANVFLAKDDKVYQIHSDGAVYEIENVYSESFDIVVGLYEAGGLEDAESFLIEAGRQIEEMTGSMQFPMVIAKTKSREVKIIKRETI